MPKRDLAFRKPLLNAAGMLGFAPDARSPVAWDELGAFVTNPISRRPRIAARSPALLGYSGGVLLHTGLPNPGFGRVLKQNSRRWEQAALPVIVSLMADRPEETREMVRALEGLENVVAAELGFAPLLSDDIIVLAVEMSMGELPLIISLPWEQVLRLGPLLSEKGAAAVSIGAPRGTLAHGNAFVSGRLFGASLLPRTLELVRNATTAGIPIIGAGGVTTTADATAVIHAGALAAQIDIALWLPGGIKKGPVA